MPSIIRMLQNADSDIKQIQKDIIELTKQVAKLKLDYGQPATKAGRRLPPTPRPAILKQLEIGRDPE